MPEAISIAQFHRRLVEMGYPSRRLRDKVRELSEHHEDLKQAGVEEGLSEQEAERRADDQLGDPVRLAESAVMLLRRSSWWGRHPLIGFGLVPVFAFIFAWTVCLALFLGLCWLLGHVFGSAYNFDAQLANALGDDPKVFDHFAAPVNAGMAFGAILLVITALWGLARRAAVGWKWVLLACAVCSAIGLFSNAGIRPHAIMFGFWWPPKQWLHAAVPLLVAALIFAIQRRRERRLAWVPMVGRGRSQDLSDLLPVAASPLAYPDVLGDGSPGTGHPGIGRRCHQ